MPLFKPEEIEQRIRNQAIPLKVLSSETLSAEAYSFKEILMKNADWVKYYQGIIADKWLEHFLSIYFLKPKDGEVMIDAASHWSPFSKIVREISNVKIYMQDMCFEPGIHKNLIGSECTNIPLPDDSIDLITVNNSIEHFEENRDALFLKEAYRLLKPGGRMCIVPLFISTVVVNMADPELDLSAVNFDPEAVLVSAKPWKIQFARYYTPETFVQRLMKAVPQFEYEIISIRDMNRFDPSLGYWQFVAYLRKPGESIERAGILKQFKNHILKRP
jgi:hypothetical protein